MSSTSQPATSTTTTNEIHRQHKDTNTDTKISHPSSLNTTETSSSTAAAAASTPTPSSSSSSPASSLSLPRFPADLFAYYGKPLSDVYADYSDTPLYILDEIGSSAQMVMWFRVPDELKKGLQVQVVPPHVKPLEGDDTAPVACYRVRLSRSGLSHDPLQSSYWRIKGAGVYRGAIPTKESIDNDKCGFIRTQ